ncbi:uncharacterized protein BXIN_2817 [Babesia sp. Xinjiang]|uniref:uncharacterized protein n=1 Tax=Babesia sp. Xinjiang TaxID=462227 RepID=UPI000A261AD1|nr:uncharacterized protein BXIN_2817 [Babesia sp. Xinjiang]ORM41668.1 hypothetical protein BXIN_2817 [Babesia sp. Xinjiang]
MGPTKPIIGATAFSRNIHLGLAWVNAEIKLKRTMHKLYCRYWRTYTIDLLQRNWFSNSRTFVNAATNRKTNHDSRKNENLKEKLRNNREMENNSNEDVRNYYDIRDPRDHVQSPGFNDHDHRAKITSRDHATEDIELNLDQQYINAGTQTARITASKSTSVTIRKKCIVTKNDITVDVPIENLNGRDVIEAILHSDPEYQQLRNVEKMYKYFYRNQNNVNRRPSKQIGTLQLLNDHICLLAKNNTLKVKEALIIAMIYDQHGLLDSEMRYALLTALRGQLYAFRPYDIAATVAVYGKYGTTYTPMLNAIGLVFYDIMIAGKTAIQPEGPSVDEIIAVVEAYAKNKLTIKRVNDAAFGTLYQHIENMTREQMYIVIKAFFDLTKDKNFVELYTKILAAILGKPILFVDNFQKWAEQQLETDFQTSITRYNSDIFHGQRTYNLTDVLRFMAVMAQCNSEHLIHAVHSRIEFRRLWTDNIRKRIMPWQGPTITSTTQLDINGLALTGDQFNDHHKITGTHIQSKSPEIDEVKIQKGEEHSLSQQDTTQTKIQNRIISYCHKIPLIHKCIVKMLIDTLGTMQHPQKYLGRIYQENKRVISMAQQLCRDSGFHDLTKLVENRCQAYYPFITTLQATVGMSEEESGQTAGKKGMETDCNTEERIIPHAYQLIREIANVENANEQFVKWTETKVSVDRGLFSYENSLKEAIQEVSIGKSDQVDYRNTIVEVSEDDLAQAIVAVSDYARYDHQHDERTIAILGELYFRLLFVKARAIETDESTNSYILKNLERITPNSLMVEHGHIPFTENRTTNLTTEFHQIKHSEYRFYRPSPIYADLFKGNGDIYGLMLYTIAHKVQTAVTRGIDEQTIDCSVTAAKTIQHVLHPFYVLNRARDNRVLRWHALYYNGQLNLCHEAKYNEQGIPVAAMVEERAEDDLTSQNIGINMDAVPQCLEVVLERTIVEATENVSQVMRYQPFVHTATIFVNVALKYIRQVMHMLEEESNLLSLSECAEISKAINVLMVFNQMLDRQDKTQYNPVIAELQQSMLAIIDKKITDEATSGTRIGQDLMAIHLEKSWQESTDQGFSDMIHNLALNMERHGFLQSTRALAAAAASMSLNDSLTSTLHTVMQVMYKRMPYMASRDIVTASMALSDLRYALQNTHTGSEEDPLGQLTQLLQILQMQGQQTITSLPENTKEVDVFSQHGMDVLIRALH